MKEWTTIDAGTGYERLHANMPDPKGPFRFEGGDQCSQCHFVYRRSKIVYHNGVPYCVPRGCYRDIAKLKEKE